jgi:hypothetical protein
MASGLFVRCRLARQVKQRLDITDASRLTDRGDHLLVFRHRRHLPANANKALDGFDCDIGCGYVELGQDLVEMQLDGPIVDRMELSGPTSTGPFPGLSIGRVAGALLGSTLGDPSPGSPAVAPDSTAASTLDRVQEVHRGGANDDAGEEPDHRQSLSPSGRRLSPLGATSDLRARHLTSDETTAAPVLDITELRIALPLLGFTAFEELAPSPRRDLDVELPCCGTNPSPRLVPIGIAHVLDLVEAGDGAAHVGSVDEWLLTLLGKREL